jgi:LysM repeat protein
MKKSPPTNGSEHTFTMRRWNGKVGINNNNCYAYAVNDFEDYRQWKAQPGERANISHDGPYVRCDRLNKSVVADNPGKVYATKAMTKCRPGFYKIMMFIAKCKKSLCQGDFHFYKQHSKTEYKVKRGDTHESIAAFFQVPVLRIKRAAKELRPGRLITFKADFFSHKRGWATGPLITGACGKLIKDPRTISRDYPGMNYDTYCRSFCVKNKGVKVGHTHPKVRQKTV